MDDARIHGYRAGWRTEWHSVTQLQERNGQCTKINVIIHIAFTVEDRSGSSVKRRRRRSRRRRRKRRRRRRRIRRRMRKWRRRRSKRGSRTRRRRGKTRRWRRRRRTRLYFMNPCGEIHQCSFPAECQNRRGARYTQPWLAPVELPALI